MVTGHEGGTGEVPDDMENCMKRLREDFKNKKKIRGIFH